MTLGGVIAVTISWSVNHYKRVPERGSLNLRRVSRARVHGDAQARREREREDIAMSSDAQILAAVNAACPGHAHRLKKMEFKKGTWNGNEYVEGEGNGSFGRAEYECLKVAKK
jgi:hypothetical protein